MKIWRKINAAITLAMLTVLLCIFAPVIFLSIPLVLSNYSYLSTHTTLGTLLMGIILIILTMLVAVWYYRLIHKLFTK